MASVLKTDDGSASALVISKDGTRFLVPECRNMESDCSEAYGWDCSDPLKATELFIKS